MNRSLRATTTRRGTPADLALIAALMQASFDPRYGEAWNSAQCMGMLSLPGAWLTIAERADAPIGFALSRSILDEAELLLIAIHPDMRESGVGRALLRTVIADARDRDVARLNLEVRANNPAIQLYLSEGFTKIGERRDYYRGSSGELFDAITYQMMLR